MLALLLALACTEPEETNPDPAPDPYPPAEQYCALAVDVFCPYYVRCGRMAVHDVQQCRETFLETCEARYQPRYEVLEGEDRIRLTRDGLEACEAHLAEVDCAWQIFDLDGPCGKVWEGLSEPGSTCAPGIESLVCTDDARCVIGLDLCGTCEAAAPVGEPCGDGVSCEEGASCVDDTCVARGRPGDACDDDLPCATGAWCEDEVCQAPQIVALGDTCDAQHRCPYGAACVGQICVETPLLGEPCDPAAGCASGWCDEDTCVPLLEPGEPCTAPHTCMSGVCHEDVCGALPGPCFED